MILLVILAIGTSVLVLIDHRRWELAVLLGLVLAFAALIWRHLVPATPPWAAQVIGASAAVGGVTAMLIIGAAAPARFPGTSPVGPLLSGVGKILRPAGVVLLIAILAATRLLDLAPVTGGAVLLLFGGVVICVTAGTLRRAAVGFVVLLFGMHLLYLALASRVNILEMMLLVSLPGGVTLVIAFFEAVRAAPRAAGRVWTPVVPDIQEPSS